MIRLIKEINPNASSLPRWFTAVGPWLYFAADDGAGAGWGNHELWRSDGTTAGTSQVQDLNPGSGSSHPKDLVVRGNIVYFTASDSLNGRQLWATDILTNSTSPLTSREMFGASSQFSVQDRGNDPNLSIAGDTLFFSAYFRDGAAISGYELWGLDLPAVVSLALMPGGDSEPISEDGPRSLAVVFHRTGDTSQPLTVSFQVGGTARFGDDYQVREASSFSSTAGAITFAAGASTAILLLDPNSDGRSEGDETVALTLLSGSGYAVASTSAVVATLVDNDVAPGQVAGTSIPARLANRSPFESRNGLAFAALKDDGSVVPWGDANSGGSVSAAVAAQLASGVSRFFSSSTAFAALKHDGSVVAWGDPLFGGDASAVALELSGGVSEIAATGFAFAARKSDGSVISWGDSRFGNLGGDSSAVRPLLAADVQQVFAAERAFAALKRDGSVVAWGDASGGGSSASVGAALSSGVVAITPSESAFAALKADGSVVAWGDPSKGGSISAGLAAQLSSGVVRVYANPHAFAALKADGSVVPWGDSNFGGAVSSTVAGMLSSGVRQIAATSRAFAALKADGSVVTWGGDYDESVGFGLSDPALAGQLSFGVERLYATNQVFAALKSDGSVVAWGNPLIDGDTGAAQAQLNSGVIDIVGSDDAFAALKADGSVVTWGWSLGGGDSSAVASQLSSGVASISSNGGAFAALKSDGSVITWGQASRGGNLSAAQASQLSSNVVVVATPFRDDRLTELPIVTITPEFDAVMEDHGMPLRFSVLRSGPSGDPLTVRFDLGGGLRPASHGSDFNQSGAIPQPSPQPWELSFAAGSSSAVFEATPIADSDYEWDETISLSLLASPDYLIGGLGSATGVILNDDPIAIPIGLRLLEIGVGAAGADPRWFTASRNRLYFQANDGAPGYGLWWSDGTRIFPTDVREPVATAAPDRIYEVGDRAALADDLYFKGYDIIHGWELWRYDSGRFSPFGSGSSLFQDFLPSFSDSGNSSGAYGPKLLTSAGRNLFFFAPILRSQDLNGDGTPDWFYYDTYLWVSDGSAMGSQPLQLLPSSNIGHAIAAGDYFYFTTPGATGGLDLWRSDGSIAGTLPLTPISVGAPFVWATIGNRLFFAADDANHGAELWMSDGTLAGTGIVKDIRPGPESAAIARGSRTMASIGDNLYFLADDGIHGQELWRSDGSADGTTLVVDLNPGSGGSELAWLTAAGGSLYFSANGRLWRSDGSAAGTVPVVGINDGPSEPRWLTAVGDRVYFTAPAPFSPSLSAPVGRELWKSDGTIEGTMLVADINLSGGSDPDMLTLVGQTLFFSATGESSGKELWSLDVSADLYSTIESVGNTALLRDRSNGNAVTLAAGRFQEVSLFGAAVTTISADGVWSLLGAETILGSNKALWRYLPSNQLNVWNLDASWSWIGSEGLLVDPNSSTGQGLETEFGLDLNGDGYIPGAITLNGLNLGSTSLGYALRSGAGPVLQVTWPAGYASNSNPGNGWRAVAATPSATGFSFYWGNSGSGLAARWELDGSGAYASGVLLTPEQLFGEEASLNLDLNGDGYTAGPTTIAGVNLGTTHFGYALQATGEAPVQVTYPGGYASNSNPGNGWTALAALPIASGYAFYWSNSGSGLAARWNLNSSGDYESGVLLSASQLIAEETLMNADLNGDAIIGSGLTTIENQGNASLLRQADGLATVQMGSDQFSVSSPFGLGVGDASSDWQMLAAETVGSQNQILWRNNPGNFYHVWTLNSSWSWQSSSGNFAPSSAAALGLETNFQLDLNGDGVIG